MANTISNVNTGLNRYLFMKNSEITDEDGNFYADICSFNIDNFEYSKAQYKERINQNYAYRFDLLTYGVYKDYFLYDELVLWLNDYLELSKDSINNVMLFPDKIDMDNYYIKNIVNK